MVDYKASHLFRPIPRPHHHHHHRHHRHHRHHDPWLIIKLVTYPAPSLALVIVDRLSKAREPPVRRPLEPHSPFKQYLLL